MRERMREEGMRERRGKEGEKGRERERKKRKEKKRKNKNKNKNKNKIIIDSYTLVTSIRPIHEGNYAMCVE